MNEEIYQYSIIVDETGKYLPMMALTPEAKITSDEKLKECSHLLFLVDYEAPPSLSKKNVFEASITELNSGFHGPCLPLYMKQSFEKLFSDAKETNHFPSDMKDLLLSEVLRYDPLDFATCNVHYNGHKFGGEPFEITITPKEASALSIAQEYFQGIGLSENMRKILSELIRLPVRLCKTYPAHGTIGVTANAQSALYDLLVK